MELRRDGGRGPKTLNFHCTLKSKRVATTMGHLPRLHPLPQVVPERGPALHLAPDFKATVKGVASTQKRKTEQVWRDG